MVPSARTLVAMSVSDGTNRARRHDEILGAAVVLTGWAPERGDELSEALRELTAEDVDLGAIETPFVVVAKASLERAEAARTLLAGAGAEVELADAWVTRDSAPPAATRTPCPSCGSTKTQPYTHAGPAARKSMKCTTCGRTFRVGSGR